jgi:endonuclease YncB( thermonuclease family)
MPRKRRPRPRPLTHAQYQRLLDAIRGLLEEGRQRAEKAFGQELVRTYHAVGKRLLGQKLAGHGGYGTATLQRLADDLVLDVRVLQQAIAFARAYPAGPPNTSLRWVHYRELLRLPDAEQRRWYEQQAIEQGWSGRKLLEAVRIERFHDRTEEKKKPAARSRKRRKHLRRPTESIYVYKATIERVVDGDTLVALVDLGFRVLKRERLRLAAIDTPALGTRKGDRALEFVRRELESVDFVLLTTDKIDLYGRYVAHVFYLPGATRKHRVLTHGQYLNQRLVEEGLAAVL